MKTNTDLLSRQLVDIELRWSVLESRRAYAMQGYERVLQARKLLKTDSGELTWTDWADVPVVEEG